MEVDLEKLKASLPCDADGNYVLAGDKVILICENISIHAILDVDDYMNWAFIIDEKDSAKAKEFFNDEGILCYSTFIDEFSGCWFYHKL